MKSKELTVRISRAFCLGLLVSLPILFLSPVANGQVIKPFTQRTSSSESAGGRSVYNIKGDFTMIGNTNMRRQDHQTGTNDHNGNTSMEYVDIDGDSNTSNSSSATLTFSTENDAKQACSNIIYAGLYWTGRAHDGISPNTFMVGGTTQNFTKNQSVNGYTLTISQLGSGDDRTATYTFTPTGGGDIVVFTYRTWSTTFIFTWWDEELKVKVGTDSFVTVPASFSNNSQTATLTAQYLINTGSTAIVVNSLGKDRDSNTIDNDFYANVSYNGKIFNKQQVKLKHAGDSYHTITANANDIYYPSDGSSNSMYSAYADVTDYVREYGLGEYFVADIALQAGIGGAIGYYGGWGMVVVYENSKMDWRDVTIFDGHAFVATNGSQNNVNVSGFNTAQNGPIDIKLGLMAGEGDSYYGGDTFSMNDTTLIDNDSHWVDLSHSLNTTTNFFNSSILTDGARNPSLPNNTGMDIAMFKLDQTNFNTDNRLMTNNQNSTRFRYGTNQDTYIIFCIAMAVDAYVPDPVGLNVINSINGVSAPGPTYTVLPGDTIEFTLQVTNMGTEPIDNTLVEIPIPFNASYVSASGVLNSIGVLQPSSNVVTFDPSIANGTILWDLGTVPKPNSPYTSDEVLAELTYRVKVTEDCNILIVPCGTLISLNGTISGTGGGIECDLLKPEFYTGL